ncbi:hypothetical protein C4561_03440 [candidate division WWE3 bacterium]|jgi:hypothetical protein|uniref:Uncharacterized protein n=1 Tax=candidate division WWE3 bacterium TaxID=2053526 RepID=A0A3A4ZC13_UNCKA|nr:MAG: hypothetical protein C4561_03440 [candidate division WWE3 bacterium]
MDIPLLSPFHMLFLIVLASIGGGVTGTKMGILEMALYWLSIIVVSYLLILSVKKTKNKDRKILCKVLGLAVLAASTCFAGMVAATFAYFGTAPLLYVLLGAFGFIGHFVLTAIIGST